MKEPEFRDRYFNPDADLPINVKPEDIRRAITRVYSHYHKMNEFHLDEFDTRFHKAFRAMNSIGDFIGHQFNDALVEQNKNLCHNPKDDLRPDIIHQAFHAAAENREKVKGIEQKAAHFKKMLTSHNKAFTNLLFIQYRVNEPDEVRDDLEPIEFTQILFADATGKTWNKNDRKEGSNRNVTYSAGDDLRHALRSNPVYENPEAITGTDHKETYRRNHAQFDPKYAERKYPEFAPGQKTLTSQ